MMRKSLLILGFLATAGFIVAGVRGYQGIDDPPVLQEHVFWALGAGLLMLLSHSAILIYLVATERMVRRTVAEHSFEPRFTAESKACVAKALPIGLLAVLALALAVVAGAGLLARFTPQWTHHASVYAALLLQLGALAREAGALSSQDRLIAELDRRVGA